MERGVNDPEAARLAAVAVFAQIYAAGVVVFAMFAVWEFGGWHQWDHSTFNEWFRRCVAVSGAAGVLIALGLPWLIVRREAKWSAQARRAAPVLGITSLAGSCVGSVFCGGVATVLLSGLIDRIEHNSLLEVLVVGASVAGFAGGALVAPLVLMVAPLVLMRRVLPKVARRLTSA